MTTYIVPPLETDPGQVAIDAYNYLGDAFPGWTPDPANLDSRVIEAISQTAAEQNDVASGVMTGVFRYFGPLVGVNPLDATPATAVATFTLTDTAGHTVNAGAAIGLTDADGNLQSFTLLADVVVAAGASTGAGTVQADTPGSIASGLAGTAELISTPGFVVGATVTDPSTSGADAEDDDVFLGRLAESLQLLTPRPILAGDYAVLARAVAGVYRATGVDNLKPGPPWDAAAEATGQARTVTVAVADTAGNPVTAAIRNAVHDYLASMREQNFLIYVVDPNYTTIAVTTTLQAWPGYDVATVQADAVAALQTYLSPAVYGTDASGDPTRWLNSPTLRQGELFEVLNGVDGVRYVAALTFGISGGAMGTTDVTLGAGSAVPALPKPGAGAVAGTGINVTVTPG